MSTNMQLFIFFLLVKVYFVIQNVYKIAINDIYLFFPALVLPATGVSLYVDIKIPLVLEQARVHSTIADKEGKVSIKNQRSAYEELQ